MNKYDKCKTIGFFVGESMSEQVSDSFKVVYDKTDIMITKIENMF